jgi:hypothetical protein
VYRLQKYSFKNMTACGAMSIGAGSAWETVFGIEFFPVSKCKLFTKI